jgi:6-phosphofructokinase 1
MVIEVMGRYAGWIALHAGLAGGGDVILVPEIPYKIGAITAKIGERLEQGKRFSLVVVAEGAKPRGGDMVVLREVNDPNDPVRLGGVSRLVGDEIEDITGIVTRYTVLGHVQRGGTPTHFDRVLATRFGYHAVEALAAGRSGVMVGLSGTEVIETPIGEAVAVPRRIDPDSDLVRTVEAMGTCLGV